MIGRGGGIYTAMEKRLLRPSSSSFHSDKSWGIKSKSGGEEEEEVGGRVLSALLHHSGWLRTRMTPKEWVGG